MLQEHPSSSFSSLNRSGSSRSECHAVLSLLFSPSWLSLFLLIPLWYYDAGRRKQGREIESLRALTDKEKEKERERKLTLVPAEWKGLFLSLSLSLFP